jgi:hypothetical protein
VTPAVERRRAAANADPAVRRGLAGQLDDEGDLALPGVRHALRHRRGGEWAALRVAKVRVRAFSGVVAEASGGRMSDFFIKIDPQELVTPGEGFGGVRVDVPPEASPRGLMQDVKIGRYLVRFVFVIFPGEGPKSGAIWTPPCPKRLKPRFLKAYRRERLEFSRLVAEKFGLPLQIIDRMDGAPRIREQIYEDGVVESVDLPVPRAEGVH